MIDKKSTENLKNFFKILYKYKKEGIISAILLLGVTLMKLPMPLLTGYIVDKVIIEKNYVQLNYICGGLILITIVFLLLGFFKDYVLFCVRSAMTIRIRLKLFGHIQNLPLSKISSKETGYLLARILEDPANLSGLFFQTFLTVVQSFITLIVGTTVIFIINWKLSLLSLVILPFFVHSNVLFIKKIKHWNNKIKEQRAVISKELSESLMALKITKLFSLYKYEMIKFLKNMKDEFKFSKKQFNFDYATSLASGFFAALGPLVVVWYGGHEVIRGNLTIGQLVAFSSLLGFLYNPTRAILNINVNFQKSLVSLNRIFEILNTPTEQESIQTKLKNLPIKNFQIEFKNVSFSYNGSKKVLDNISLKIKDNEKIAILGPTGVGKTSLVCLLTRLFEPDHGSIFIGGRNIKDIPLNQLRQYVGFVSQEDFLFSTTIYNNIKIGDLRANQNDVIKAAKLANAYQFIQSLPNGFDTIVGEQGEYLSGGQRQLICLARVILKNPPILILDEPTSAIDSETEKLILDSLQSFINERVTILISHRLSTTLKVDRIVILENGRISNIGTHEDLIKGNEFYYKIFINQIESLTKKQSRAEIL
ncbi:MAG: ABC transporter ATP-binding protein [Promethearchaeota archaeon]